MQRISIGDNCASKHCEKSEDEDRFYKMWSGNYNPFVGFEALLSSSDRHGENDPAPFSSNSPSLRSSGPSSDESLFDNAPLSVVSGSGHFEEPHPCLSSGSRIELPGGGFIELPTALLSDDNSGWQSPSANNKDVLNQKQQQYHLAKINALERESAEKDLYISQISNENLALRQEINKLLQAISDQNLESYQFRLQSARYAHETEARIGDLEQTIHKLHNELSAEKKKCSIRGELLDEAREERKALKQDMTEKNTEQEKSIRDLITKNHVLEQEMLAIPRMMTKIKSKCSSNTAVEIHCPRQTHPCLGNAPHLPAEIANEEGEQKSSRHFPPSGSESSSATEDAERIEVLESNTEVHLMTDVVIKSNQTKLSSIRRWFSRKLDSR